MIRFLRYTMTFLVFIALPYGVSADVFIHEVAWMGTQISANSEWIELYNSGDSAVSLDGWRIAAVDGAPDIALSGSIAPGGYFLLERTSDETVPGVVADLIYTGALGNSGEVLELYNAEGARIDRLEGSDNWALGGDNDSKDTLQRVGAGWVTALPTPAAANTTEQTQRTESQTAGAVSKSTQTTDRSNSSTSAGSAQSILQLQETNRGRLTRVANPLLSVAAGADRIAHVGVPVTFVAEGTIGRRDLTNEEAYVWNMGDGTVLQGREVSHVYQHPGTYVVAVEARVTMFREEKHAFDTLNVMVEAASVSVQEISDTYIELSNASADRVDLSGMKMTLGAQVVELPAHTYIAGNGVVRLMRSALGISKDADTTHLGMLSAAGYPILRYDSEHRDADVSASASGESETSSQVVAASLARMTTGTVPPTDRPRSQLAADIAEVTKGYAPLLESTNEVAEQVREEPQVRTSPVVAVSEALPQQTRNSGLWAWIIMLLALVAGASVVVLGLGRAESIPGETLPSLTEQLLSHEETTKSAHNELPPAEAFRIIEADIAPADKSASA